VFQRKDGTLTIPALPNTKITKAYFMNGDAVTVKSDNNSYKIDLPTALPDENCSVIVLELDKNALNIPVIPVKA
jgi:alpha-L-fucosidase